MNITNSCIKYYLSFFNLAVLHLYQLNRSDVLNARKIQEFVVFISRLFLRYPREAFGSWTTDTNLINGPNFLWDFNIIKFFFKILLLLFYFSNLT